MKRKEITIDNVLAKIQAAVSAVGSQRQYAKQIGVSTAYLNDVLNRKREPGEKILHPLGLRKVVIYKEASE